MKVFGLMACAAAAITKKEAVELVLGLGEGFFLGSDPLAATCVKDTATIEKSFADAVSKIAKKDKKDVFDGLVEVAETLKDFPRALADCKAVEADVEQVVAALELMKKPKEFVYHMGKDLIINHKQIFHEIFSAVDDFQKSDYTDGGKNVGLALRKLIVGAFDEFIAAHGKSYTPVEKQHRFQIFARNILHIAKMQSLEQGSAVYSHLSPFADVDVEEFGGRMGLLPHLAQEVEQAPVLDASALPTSFDWRAKGAVTPVQNQAHCSSCWAFATVANIEGVNFVHGSKQLTKLSEQQLVDCDTKTGDHGCQGGLPTNAFKDMIDNKFGLELETAYPYTAQNGECHAQASLEKVFITNYKQLSTDEDQIAAGLMQYGPLAIGINATMMQFYFGGIAHPWKIFCNPKKLDHGVTIVAFGEQDVEKYWVIKNSWGPGWGEKGYYYVKRGSGVCGLNTMVATAEMGSTELVV